MWSQAQCWRDLDPAHLHFNFEGFPNPSWRGRRGGWSPARLSVGGMAPGGAMKGSMARGCSSLQGGGSNSGNMARWRQIITGSLRTRWVLTEPTPRMFLLILFAVNFPPYSMLLVLGF